MRHRCSSSLPPAPTKRLKSSRFHSSLTAHGSHCSKSVAVKKNLPQYDHTCRRDCHRKQIHTFKCRALPPEKLFHRHIPVFFFLCQNQNLLQQHCGISDSNGHGITGDHKTQCIFRCKIKRIIFYHLHVVTDPDETAIHGLEKRAPHRHLQMGLVQTPILQKFGQQKIPAGFRFFLILCLFILMPFIACTLPSSSFFTAKLCKIQIHFLRDLIYRFFEVLLSFYIACLPVGSQDSELCGQ